MVSDVRPSLPPPPPLLLVVVVAAAGGDAERKSGHEAARSCQ